MDDPPTDFKTPAQLVERYPVVSVSLIYAACKAGELPHYRLRAKKEARGKYAIKESDFLAWMESNRVEGIEDDDEELQHIH